MLEYRRMGMGDIDAVRDFALKALALSADLPVHVSVEKVRNMVKAFAIGHEHWNQIAVKEDGQIVGAMALYVAEMPFHERSEGHVMICYATEPGAGAHMIRDMMAWVAADSRIQRVQWAMNAGVGRLCSVIQRRWRFRRHETLIHYKGDLCQPQFP